VAAVEITASSTSQTPRTRSGTRPEPGEAGHPLPRWYTRLIDVGGLVADDAYNSLVQAGQIHGSPVRYTWRYFVGPERLRAGQLDVLIRDLRRLETTFPQTQATTFALEGTAMA